MSGLPEEVSTSTPPRTSSLCLTQLSLEVDRETLPLTGKSLTLTSGTHPRGTTTPSTSEVPTGRPSGTIVLPDRNVLPSGAHAGRESQGTDVLREDGGRSGCNPSFTRPFEVGGYPTDRNFPSKSSRGTRDWGGTSGPFSVSPHSGGWSPVLMSTTETELQRFGRRRGGPLPPGGGRGGGGAVGNFL